ncbi:MAG: FixH family protein [Pseudomonadota bacterium]
MADTQRAAAHGRGAKGELKGRHVLIIALTAFGVIVTANMALLFAATGSFPGMVVENSYRAGVGWNDRAAAQAALGWDVRTSYDGSAITVAVTDASGRAVEGVTVEAMLGRPAGDVVDRTLTLSPAGGVHSAPAALGPGSWRIALRIEGGASPWQGVAPLYVPLPRGDAG